MPVLTHPDFHGIQAKARLPEPYIPVEICTSTPHRIFQAEWDAFWRAWFDMNGNPLPASRIWLWRPINNRIASSEVSQ